MSGESSLAIDAQNLYLATFESTGQVLKIPLGGGAPTTLASGQAWPIDLVVDATDVYWVNAVATMGQVMRVPIAGGLPIALASNQDLPLAVAVDDLNVYWVTRGYSSGTKDNGMLWSIPKNGGIPTVLAKDQRSPLCLLVDGTGVYWSNDGDTVTDKWWEHPSGAIRRIRAGGHDVIDLATSILPPHRLVMGGADLYWGVASTIPAPGHDAEGVLMRISRDGGQPILVMTGGMASALAADATRIYWFHVFARATSPSPIALPLAGGSASRLGPEVGGGPSSVAVGKDALYWTNSGTIGLWKVALPVQQ